jgi:hypothetical protein
MAWEFYAFMALAAWLVYTQFIKPKFSRGREDSDAATGMEKRVDASGRDSPGDGS